MNQYQEIEESYQKALKLQSKGYTKEKIQKDLLAENVDFAVVELAMMKLENTPKEANESFFVESNKPLFEKPFSESVKDEEESSVLGWIIWIAVIGGINLLSYLFDWPFWIY